VFSLLDSLVASFPGSLMNYSMNNLVDALIDNLSGEL